MAVLLPVGNCPKTAGMREKTAKLYPMFVQAGEYLRKMANVCGRRIILGTGD